MTKTETKAKAIAARTFFCDVSQDNDKAAAFYTKVMTALDAEPEEHAGELDNFIVWEPFETYENQDVAGFMTNLVNETKKAFTT